MQTAAKKADLRDEETNASDDAARPGQTKNRDDGAFIVPFPTSYRPATAEELEEMWDNVPI